MTDPVRELPRNNILMNGEGNQIKERNDRAEETGGRVHIGDLMTAT